MDAKLGHKMDANMGLIRQIKTDAKLRRTPTSIPIRGLKTFNLQYPGSTTKRMPSIVNEVSAIFVATTHFLIP
uniref:Uncharacterized protein n=1 Tax=Romanomermis culicivorax TaxID=13658 RepID=A0A915KKV5_ROMCU